MVVTFVIIIFNLTCLYQLNAKMEPKTVGGEKTNIENYPHSAHLNFFCGPVTWECGSSILNQKILLTAAHCFDCSYSENKLIMFHGNKNSNKGFVASCTRWIIHERYSYYDESTLNYDIALVLVKRKLKFSAKTGRVAIMKWPPKDNTAYVAGWGMYDVNRDTSSKQLRYIKQKVWTHSECNRVIQHLPVGVFCAGGKHESHYAAKGDSGSALVIRRFIQIGIVSHKIESISNSLVIYIDTGYFFDWIMRNSKNLYCYQ